MNFITIPVDKKLHMLAGAAITATVALYLDPLAGVLACALVGAAKEVYDKVSGKGHPELLDFVATVFGSVVILPRMLGIV